MCSNATVPALRDRTKFNATAPGLNISRDTKSKANTLIDQHHTEKRKLIPFLAMAYNAGLLRFFACLILSLVFFSTFSGASPATLTIGYFRVTGVDSPYTLASYLAAIRKANDDNLIPGYTVVLDVVTVDCPEDGCEGVLGLFTSKALISDFISRMPGYVAIVRPCHLVAPQFIDAVPGIPIFDPITVRSADQVRQNLIMFNAHVRFEIRRLFTFMQHEAGCAISGIMVGDFSELKTHVEFAASLYENGGLPRPKILDMVESSEQEIRDFVVHNSEGRMCYLVLSVNRVFRRVVDALSRDTAFRPSESRMYAISLAGGDTFTTASGDSSPYAYSTFVRWFPTLHATDMQLAKDTVSILSHWEGVRTPAELALFRSYGIDIDGNTSHFSLQGLLVMQYVLLNIQSTAAKTHIVATKPPSGSQWWTTMIDVVFTESSEVGGYPFVRAVRRCPPKPLEQMCFCNLVTTTSYLYKVNASRRDGGTDVVWDNEAAGQRSIASVTASCSEKVDGWSYPITGLSIEPLDFAPRIGMSALQVEGVNSLTNKVYGETIRDINYAAVAPARPYRYALLPAPGDGMSIDTDALLSSYTANYNPFVILGSMAGSIWHPEILTLFPSLIEIEMEDPVLVPHSQWTWQLINIRPVLADLIHAAVSYYAENAHLHTSVHALTSSPRGAELISLSFATFGFLVPATSVVVSRDPIVWHDTVHAWLSNAESSNPFVLAATTSNPGGSMDAAFRAGSEVSRGILILCLFEALFYQAFLKNPLPKSNTSDILISTYLREWWMGSTEGVPEELVPYVTHPRYHIVASAIAFMKRLGDSVQYDFKRTAADVLYSVQTVSTEFGTYGPFSNQSCSSDEIRTQERDRRCQCGKGVRDIYVQSAQNWLRNEWSTRTGRYKYTLTTCGVVYRPYVAPIAEWSLSDGAIAGIAVGVSLAVIGLLASAVLVNYFCLSRNNRTAPKDSSKPFGMVFTDIQASTALWARAPLAMSEAIENHHRVIRQCIRRCGGYEVKTVGDSFMVAFGTADDSVRFALDVQVSLNRSSWSTEIDANYIEILAEAGIFDDDHGGAHRPIVDHRDTIELRSEFSLASAAVFAQKKPQGRVSVGPVVSIVAEGHAVQSAAGNATSTIVNTVGTSTAYHTGMKAAEHWHGVRVRIGVHFGMGEIRKDPVSLGYDYYGSVVNIAARVEGVGHGGQTLVTSDAYGALSPNFLGSRAITVISLGPQPLRGLDAPITLYQMVPTSLECRKFPPLRLHIEKETEDTVLTDSNTVTTEAEQPEVVAKRLCSSKQFAGLSVDSLMLHYNFLQTLLGPANENYRVSVIAKLAEAWGFESSMKAARHESSRVRLVVSLLGKVTKSFNATRRVASLGRSMASRNEESASGSHHVSIVEAKMRSAGSAFRRVVPMSSVSHSQVSLSNPREAAHSSGAQELFNNLESPPSIVNMHCPAE